MAKKQVGVIDVAPENPDVALVAADGSQAVEFFRNATVFFKEAQALETSAKASLSHAKLLKPPTTMEEDADIQAFVKSTSVAKKAIEEHWTITSVFNTLHKRLVAARQRGVLALEQANQIGNTLHNQYVEKERRRVAEEQERVRLAAEAQARKDREKELAAAEQRAIDLEEQSGDLSEREQAFVAAYAGDNSPCNGNGIESARRVGFKDALKHSARLLSLPKIQAAIKASLEAQAIRKQAAAKREQPLEVDVPKVEANVARGAGGFDRTTYSAEVVDARLFVEAVIGGRHAIPADTLMPSQTQLNEYARSLRDRINLWPGVRLVKNTKLV